MTANTRNSRSNNNQHIKMDNIPSMPTRRQLSNRTLLEDEIWEISEEETTFLNTPSECALNQETLASSSCMDNDNTTSNQVVEQSCTETDTNNDKKDSKNMDDDEESVASLGFKELLLRTSIASKSRHSNYDCSMPGLVSFCHGSFATEASSDDNMGSTWFCEDSVSSLECSLKNDSYHCKSPKTPKTKSSFTSTLHPTPDEEDVTILSNDSKNSKTTKKSQMLSITTSNSVNHQESRWGVARNNSNDSMPRVARRG